MGNRAMYNYKLFLKNTMFKLFYWVFWLSCSGITGIRIFGGLFKLECFVYVFSAYNDN